MKLKDLFEELDKAGWMKANAINPTDMSHEFAFGWDKDGIIASHVKNLFISAKSPKQELNFPFKIEHTLAVFGIDAIYGFNEYVVKDLSFVADAKKLVFCKAIIESFKGIDKISNLQAIGFSSTCQFADDVGLLRLLKCKSLEFIEFNPGDFIKANLKIADALLIVQSHLKTKNVPECQQELIEEGLQRYAKL